jgi:thioredoxin-related protein
MHKKRPVIDKSQLYAGKQLFCYVYAQHILRISNMFRYSFIVALLLPFSALADAPEGYPFQAFDKAMKQANAEAKLMFVYFGRYGCGYCDKTNKEAFSDPRVRQEYTNNYILAYVDSESGNRLRLPTGERVTERELGTRYNAFVTPVFSFMAPDGTIVFQMIGVQSKEDLMNANNEVQKALKKAGAS